MKIISDIYNSKILSLPREAPCDNRLLIWTVGLEALSKRPILGYGQENFEHAIPGGKMHKADNAHNIFLETAMSSGLIGLFIFLGIVITSFRKASFTVGMSLLAFLIVAQFNPLSIVQISLFWFLLAFATHKNSGRMASFVVYSLSWQKTAKITSLSLGKAKIIKSKKLSK